MKLLLSEALAAYRDMPTLSLDDEPASEEDAGLSALHLRSRLASGSLPLTGGGAQALLRQLA